MILQSLVQYYEALEQKGEITRPGWCIARVSFALELSPNGDLKRIISLKNEVPKGKKTVWEPQKLKVPQMITRSSGVTANFLCDNSSYFLGIDNKGKPERSENVFYVQRRNIWKYCGKQIVLRLRRLSIILKAGIRIRRKRIVWFQKFWMRLPPVLTWFSGRR